MQKSLPSVDWTRMLTALLHWMRQTRKDQRFNSLRTPRSRRSQESSLFDRLIPESLRSLLRASQSGRALSLESYEDRLLYSAAPAPAPAPDATAVQVATLESVIEAPSDVLVPVEPAATESGATESADAASTAGLDLIVIDPAIPDAESLIARLTALQTDPDRILVLDSQHDGLVQIADRLELLGQTRAIHILSHGDEAGLRLGSNWLSSDTLAFRAGTLASWQPYLMGEADVLFYGCDLAGNATGQEFLRSFGQLTGTDVAASTDATGAALLGGDWNLEFQVGNIETPSLGQQFQLFDWNGLLSSNTYQEGASSYAGTQDTSISATNPISSFGASTTVTVGGVEQKTGLIRFDSLFGNGPNQIPLGSTILSASLQLNVTSATSPDALIALHRVMANWSETSTYSSLGSGLTQDDLEVCTIADGMVDSPDVVGTQLVNGLEDSLQAWSDGSANLGWAIYGNNETNWAFSSAEAATASLRPMLLVSYTPPAPPTVEVRTTGEIRVNAATTDIQTTLVDTRNAHGSVGVDANGNYVVVWTSSNSDGSGSGVFAQRYNARGVSQGRPIQVNTTTTGDQKWGTIAVRSDGGFIVTWTSVGQDGSATGNYVRIFDSSGVGGSEILVNSTTTGDQYAPSIGVAADGSFVVTWAGSGSGDTAGIYFQKFSSTGTRIGSEQRVNSSPTNIQYDPSIAVGQDGQFMVVWDDTTGTHGRRFNASGGALDANDLLIHADLTSGNADVATNGTGDYHIVWRTTGGGDGSGRGLWRLSLGAADTTPSAPQQVTTDTINDQTEPAISSDADGNFIITWQGSGPGDTAGVFARKFLSDGTAVGTEFQLNETTAGSQVGVSTALVNHDNYIAVWSGNGPGDNNGIFLRAEGTLKNQASLLFTTSNNVTASGSSTVPNWTTGDVLGLGQPNLTLGDNTTGTLSIVGNVNAIANDGDVSLAGLDVIQHDVLVAVGAHQVQLYAGDVLFSVVGVETLGSLTIQSDDILIFRPLAPWNYAAGQISVLFDGIQSVGGGTVLAMADFDLVDVDTQVGDVLLTAGSLVMADSVSSNSVQVFHPTNAGLTTTSGTTQTLLKESEIPLDKKISGLHLIERDVRVGGVNLESGDLLIATNSSATVGDNGLAVTQNDVVRLQIQETSVNGPADVTASMLVNGADVALDTSQEAFLSLAMVHVGDPPRVQDETYQLTEGQTFQSQDMWHMPGWNSRMQLTFNNSSRAENLDDFPILVTLDTNRFDYSLAQSSGNDLRFVDANGTVLSYEIETWNPNGQSSIWVKVPRIDASSSTDSMWLYYGSSSAASGQNATDVWSNGYVGVWHMNGNPSGTQTIQDSSSSNVDGTATGMDATNQVNGPIGGALKFDGTSEYIRVATTSTDPTAVDPSQLTIEAWANSTGDTGFAERIVNRRHTVLIPFESYGLATSSSDGTKLVNATGTPDLAGTTGSLPADRWRYVTGVLSGSTSSLYVDGALNATDTGVTSLGSSDDDITIGAGEMGLTSTVSQYWRGGIDEVRLSNVARSAAWTAAQYASMTDSMITYGDRQSVAGVLDNETTTASGSLTVSRVDLTGAADFASVTVLDDGRVLADPGTAFESLGAGQTTTRQIQYTVMDAYGNSDLGTATLVVHGVNDAPVINTAVGPLRLSDIAEDPITNSGTTVSQILTSVVGTLITDIDTGARQGMAITGANTTNGSWEYSLDGSTWSSLAGVSDTTATLLDVTARVRFVPNPNFNGNAGAITFRAWDQSAGTNGQTGVNVSTNGGATAFSTTSTTASITVTGVNDAPVLMMGPALTVLEGGQVAITSTSVNATDVENPAGSLTFTVTGGLGFGHLERSTAPGTAITTFTQAEINNNQIIYVHSGAESVNDFVGLAVSDGQTIVTGNLNFTITPVNDAPTFDANRITLSEGQAITLSTVELLTNDPDATATSLVYTVNSVTNGRFERASAPGTAITTFTQDDINNSRIRFVHNGGEAAPAASLSVTDGTTSIGPRSMAVIFTNVNDSPTVTTNAGLTLNEGATKTIRAVQLTTTDSDNSAAQLTYSLSTAPAYGRLEKSTNPGVAITSFKQSDINAGTIRYVHDGGESTSDSFNFTVSDGSASASGSFSITVTPVNDPPALTVNSLPVSEGQIVTLTTSQLDASDTDSSTRTFTVGGVTHGQFRNTVTSAIVTSFTRAQIVAGIITFTHDGSETLPTATISVSDGTSSTAPVAISFTYTGVNDAPVIATNAGATVAEGGVITIGSSQLLATDIDNTPTQLTYTIVTAPTHGRLELTTNPGVVITSFTQDQVSGGTIRYVHDGSNSISDGFAFSVSDGALTAVGTFAITVTSVNDAPVITTNTGLSVNEGGTTTLGSGQLSASDSDNTPAQLVYSLTSAPAHGRLERVGTPGVVISSFTQADINSGSVRYVHDGSETTTDSLSFTLTDGGTDVTGTFSITISAVNDPPVLDTNTGVTVDEGGVIGIVGGQLLAVDSDNTPGQLVYTVTTSPAHGRLEIVTNPGVAVTSFTQSDIDSRTLRYVHDGSESTSDAFVFSVSDGAQTVTGSFAVTVNSVNDSPVISTNAGAIVSEGGLVSIGNSQLLTSDSDNLPVQLAYTVTTGPAHGRLELASNPGVAITSFTQSEINNGAVRYVHDGSSTTTDLFGFTVSDGSASESGTFSISVTSVNNSPVMENNLGLTVSEGGSSLISDSQLLAVDADNSASQLIYTLTAAPSHGRVERVGNPGVGVTSFSQADINSGAVRYVHDGSQTNADLFTFTVSDGSQSVTGAFGITVAAINNPPLPVNNTGLAVNEGGVGAIGGLKLSFSDADNSPAQLAYSVTTLPSHGRLERNTNPGIGIASFTQDELNSGSIRYVHDGGETVSDSFTFSVTDGTATVTGSFAITISPVNDSPVLTISSFSISEGQTITLTTANFGASDPDNSTITFQVSGVTHGQFVNTTSGGVVTSFTNAEVADGLITFTHDGSQFAPTVSLSVTDGGATSSPVNVSIGFTPVNDPPVVSVNTGAVVLENGSVVLNATKLSTADEEQAATQLIYTVTAAPTEGRLERVGSPGVAITSFTQADLNGGQVRYVQLGSEAASDRLDFSVTDGTSSITGQFNVSITPVNDPPVLNLGLLAVTQGATVTLTPASVDATDSDSPVLTFTVSSMTHGQFINTTTGLTVTSFTTSQIAAGEIAFVHDHSELAPTGLIQVSDGNAASANQSLLFDYQNTNSAPTISAQTFNLPENAAGGTPVGLVIGNDTDLRDRLSFLILSGPSSSLFKIDPLTGQIIVASGAVFDFEAQPVHTLTVQVQDLAGATATATVTVQLTNVNEAPVALGFAPANGLEDGPALSIDLTRGFQDPDRTALTFRIVSTSNPGLLDSFTILPSGQLAVSGRPNAYGDCDLTIEASDAGGLTARTTLRISLASVNDVPVAVGETTTLVTGDSILIDPATLLKNDSDLDGDTLTVVLTSQPAHGKLIQNSNGTYSYQTDPGFSGLDGFTYTVTDGSGTSSPVSMGIDVQIVATSGTSSGSGSGNGFATTAESASTVTDSGNTSTTDGAKGGSGTTGQATTNSGPAANGMSASGDSGAVGSNQKADNSNVVGPLTTHHNDDDLGVLIVRKAADLSDFGPRTSKSQSDSDSQRERSHIQRALDSLITSGPQATVVDLAGSMASLQLTQLRHAFTSQANVAAFEQIAQSLNAEMGGELAFEVPALAGASLTVGYVVWMLRGGMLVTSLLAQMPAWRLIDPLVFLDSLDKSVEDDESLGSLVEHGQSELEAV
jgi:VCBS repeat-containing protein